MEITVIVPFLNEELYIRKCLSALQKQKPTAATDIIFVDNGSTDRSANIVQSFESVKLITEKRANVYAARNKALSFSKSSIIGFTDADCSVSTHWTNAIEEGFKNKSVGIIVGKRVFPKNRDIFLRYLEDYDNAKMKFVIKSGNVDTLFGFTNNMAIRKKAISAVKGFKELKVNGDTDLVQNIARNTQYTIRYSEKMSITHLEITSCYVWYKKMYLYGFHNKKLSQNTAYKALSVVDNFSIFKAISQKYTFTEKCTALLALGIGMLCYKLGETKTHL